MARALVMRVRPAVAVLKAVQAVACRAHAEREKQVLIDQLDEKLPGLGVDHVADQRERDVLITIASARIAGQRHAIEPTLQFLIRHAI